MKRLVDILFSIGILGLFFPLGCFLSLAILFESKGGIFYRQERIGKDGKAFFLLKFRSMRPLADQSGKLTIGTKDPRITRVGTFIRKYKLDEFPQFINVLKGEMSLVGPRPEVSEYVELYSQEQQKVLGYKPGITDVASLAYFEENRLLAESQDPHRTYVEEIMPEKLRLNLDYQQKANVLTDIGVIIRTALRILK
ncbi:MAG: sugar transferase [Flavobacteriia bacterium]|jgi:lipopolysaccharide/colanic/teichoic acid biosynthesis glycosyltransferase|nr:sugar transferase [Flavobacteriia bacterium]NBV90889.1 sugar transferase [Flavobacteriia bacterium]NBY41046.1 sugar transferase [Flavobacteriia bacterium]